MPADAAAAADQNLLKAASVWAAAAEGGQVDQFGGATFVRCAVPAGSFNQVLILRRPDDLAGIVARTPDYFRSVGGQFRLRVREDVEPMDDRPFLAAGLVRSGGIPCMSALTINSGGPTPIEIRAVVDEETLAQHVDVVAASFGWQRPELARVFRRELLDAVSWRAYVGYRGGQAVTTAQLVVAGDVAGLYWVGTVEAARGQGYGEAITRHAMAEAALLGCSLSTLQASLMGLPIYERIGFTRASLHRFFVAPDA